MKGRRKAVLLLVLGLLLAAPVGFAVAQIVDGSPSVSPGEEHTDPDPSSDPVELMDAYRQAEKNGDQAAKDESADAIRDEIVSRMGAEEKAAAEGAPPQADVPADTEAYVAPDVPAELVENCRRTLETEGEDKLCRLIVLNAEGKARSGAYSHDEVEQTLQEAE